MIGLFNWLNDWAYFLLLNLRLVLDVRIALKYSPGEMGEKKGIRRNMKNEVQMNVFDLRYKSFCMSSVDKLKWIAAA